MIKKIFNKFIEYLTVFINLIILIVALVLTIRHWDWINENIKMENFVVLLGIFITSSVSMTTVAFSNLSTHKNLENSKSDRIANTISNYRMEWLRNIKELTSDFEQVLNKITFRLTENIKSIGIKEIENDFLFSIYKFKSKMLNELNVTADVDNQIIYLLDEIERLLKLIVNIDLHCVVGEVAMERNIEIIRDSKLLDILEIKKFTKLHEELAPLCENYDYESDYKTELILKKYDNIDIVQPYINTLVEDIIKVKEKMFIIFRIYFKTEWERIKFEIENGVNAKFNFDKRYKELLDTHHIRKYLVENTYWIEKQKEKYKETHIVELP
jgi:hypothetical protein